MEKQPFSYRKTFILGFGFLGISVLWPIFNQFIPIFLQAGNPSFEGATEGIKGFALGPSLALFIMTWDNLINVFVQPWVGERSDRTWNRFGRRKPWILVGLPIAAIAFIFIPLAPTLFAIAVFILITNLGMALFRSPTVAWLGDIFPPEQRSKANGMINLMGGLGGLLAYFVGGYLFNNYGQVAPFIFGSVLMVAAILVAVRFVKEPRNIEMQKGTTVGVLANLKTVMMNQDKSGLFVLLGILFWFMAFNALETGLSSFAVFTLGIKAGTASIMASSVTLALLAFSIPAGLLGSKYGRRAIIRIGLTGLIILTLGGYFLVKDSVSFIAILVLVGFAWAMVNVNSLPLVYDYGDERKIGAYTGLYYFSSQTAAILGPTLGGVLVESLGSEYRWLWLFGTVFMVLAWLAIQQVRPKAPAA